MPADDAAGQISAHVAELRDRYQIETVKLSADHTAARSRSQIQNLSGEIEKPEDVKQTEQRVSHRLQRFVIAQAREHLPAKDRQQKKEQHRHFEVVGTGRADGRKIMKTSGQQDRAADQSGDFEIRQAPMIE